MTKCVRSFFVAILTFLSVITLKTDNCSAQTNEKPLYQFEDTRISQADTLLAQKQYTEALKAYQQTLNTYSTESFYEGMVYATERMAFCHRRLGDDKLSAQTFQKAINMAKEKLEPNHMLLSKAYLNNGIRAHFKNIHFDAVMLIDSAKSTFDKGSSIEAYINRKTIEYKFYTYYYIKNNHDTLIKYLDLRADLFEREMTLTEKILLTNDYSRAYNSLGDYYKATTYATESFRLAKKVEESIRPFHYAEALFNLGWSLVNNKKYGRALEVTDELISFTLKNNPSSADLRGFYNLKGVTLNGLGRINEASEMFKMVIELLEQANKENNVIYSVALSNLGLFYMKTNQPELSEKYFSLALKHSKLTHDFPDPKLVARYNYLALHYSDRDYYKALMYYDSAFKSNIMESHGELYDFPKKGVVNPTYETINLLMKKMSILLKLSKRKDLDTTLLNSTLDYSENLHFKIINGRKRFKTVQGKIHLAKEFKSLYQHGLEAAYYMNQIDGSAEINIQNALKNVVRSKALVYLEQMGDFSSINNSIVPLAIRNRFSEAMTKIDSLDNQINQQITIDPLGDSVIILNSEKMKWNARLAQARETIEKEYASSDNDLLSKDVSIKSVRADHQLTAQKALVEYFVGDSVIFVVGLSGEKASFHRIKKDQKLNEALSGFLGEVNTKPNLAELEAHLKNFGETAFTLYQSLLKPVLDDLGDISEMIIVPDDILSRVPFEMLISDWSGNETSFKELNYLLKSVKVSHLLSSKVSFNELAQSQGKGMLGFGYAGEGIVDERAEMGGLPGALKEINFLKSNFSGDYFMGKEGTKRQFLKKAGDYDVIHLALHGKSDSVNRYNSALVFNGDSDYYMTSTDLYRTRLKSKLAVLSACETGIGKISEGEGSFSIARGFAIAGVPAIVTTLWKVNDEAGATITQQFYRNLQSGNQKDEALRQAKLKYLATSDNLTSSPFYWGSYILIGDTSTIKLKEKARLPWYWILVAFLILSALGLGLRRLSRKPFDQAA